MTIDSNDFSSVNPRFLVPLDSFEMRIYYNELFLLPNDQTVLRSILSRALLGAASKYSAIRPRDISTSLFQVNSGDPQESESGAIYSSGIISLPVYGFVVQIGRTQLRIIKANTSVVDLLTAMSVMSDLLQILFPPTPTTGSFVDVLDMRDAVYATSFSFSHRLRLVEDVTNRAKQPTNIDVAERLLNISLPPGSPSRDSPLGALQLRQVVRADASVIGYREFDSGSREVAIQIDCPHNISQVDIDVNSACRSGDHESPFDEAHVRDLKTPVLSFFKDLVLTRLFDDLFGQYAIEARL